MLFLNTLLHYPPTPNYHFIISFSGCCVLWLPYILRTCCILYIWWVKVVQSPLHENFHSCLSYLQKLDAWEHASSSVNGNDSKEIFKFFDLVNNRILGLEFHVRTIVQLLPTKTDQDTPVYAVFPWILYTSPS